MQTCCPECKTCFRITQDQLKVAQGLVRCGQCNQVFDARDYLQADTPAEIPQPSFPSPESTFQASEIAHFDLDSVDNEVDKKQTGKHAESGFTFDEELDVSELNMLSSQPGADTPISSSAPGDKETPEETKAKRSDEISLFDDIPVEDQHLHRSINFSAALDHELSESDINEAAAITSTHLRVTDKAPASYVYTDINDDLQEEKNIADIFSDMNQQLSLPEIGDQDGDGAKDSHTIDEADEPSSNPSRPPSRTVHEDEELNSAIDRIFSDSPIDFGEAVTEPEEDDYRIEKEVLASLDRSTGDQAEDEFEDNNTPQTRRNKTRSPLFDEDDIPLRLRESLLTPPPARTSLLNTLAGLFLFLLLSILLLAQVALFRNTDIIAVLPEAQPWLERYCSYVPCRINSQTDLDKIHIIDRDIRAHKTQKNALLITATIVNKANFNQPYPDINVMLSDLTGATVAQRRFTPANYMGELNSPFLLMKPGIPVHISIGVIDPGRDAVNFEFSFM